VVRLDQERIEGILKVREREREIKLFNYWKKAKTIIV